MTIKKAFLCVCMAALLFSMSAHAAVNICTHPTSIEMVDRGFNKNSWQHQEWSQEYEVCKSCGAKHHVDAIEYESWEDHVWIIDWSKPDKIDDQLTFYEAICSVCGFQDTLANP